MGSGNNGRATHALLVGGSARSGGPAVGSADSYVWQVRNGGSQVAGGLTLKDALPPSLEFQSVSVSGGGCSGPPAGSLGALLF